MKHLESADNSILTRNFETLCKAAENKQELSQRIVYKQTNKRLGKQKKKLLTNSFLKNIVRKFNYQNFC